MIRIAITTFIVFMMLAASGNAAWFARLDSGNRLVVTGIATDADGIFSTITLTCTGGQFTVEILTRSNAEQADLSSHSGAKVAIDYRLIGGEVKKFQVSGVPVIVAGGILGIVSDLSIEQSRAIFDSIGRGYPIEIEITHPELLHDVGKKRVTRENFTQAIIAISEHCQGFK